MKTNIKRFPVRRVITTVLFILAIISVISESAFAADEGNWQDTYFYSFSVPAYPATYSPLPFDEIREKRTDSAMYLRLGDTSLDYVYVKALGSPGEQNMFTNFTYYNGQYVDHVSCKERTPYEVHNYIYETFKKLHGINPNALFAFGSPFTTSGIIYSGAWSPDCKGSYTDATP